MKTFTLTNEQIPGEIYLHEDDCGKVRCDFSKSDATIGQQKFVLNIAELGIAGVRNAISQDTKLVELQATFDAFWNRYDHKDTSSKIRTEKKWNKMSKVEQQRAYNHVPKYFAKISQDRTAKKYAETYLNDQLWNN